MKVFPHQTLVSVAESMDKGRAQSLKFRFDNEEQLLNKANEKLFFGWGGWGRNRVYSESGKDISVTDGRWIQVFGKFGMLGFIAEFSFLIVCVFRARKAAALLNDTSEKAVLAAHALLVSIVLIDQLPNASLSPWLWLLAGCLLGRSEFILSQKVKV